MKKFLRVMFILLFPIILYSTGVQAEEVINAKELVNKDKVWDIKFNKALNSKTMYSNIRVYNSETKEFKAVKLNYDESLKTVSVLPLEPYEEGYTYEMIIDNSVKSEEEKNLNDSIKYIFTIEGTKKHLDRPFEVTKIGEGDTARYSIVFNGSVSEDEKDKIMSSFDTGEIGKYYKPDYKHDDAELYFDLVIKEGYSDSKAVEMITALNEKEDKILQEIIKPNMLDYEKELAIHDYIVNSAYYDERVFSNSEEEMPEISYTAYGITINGTGVCSGYAKAVGRLLKKVGIESIYATGYGIDEYNNKVSHGWNIVNIQNEYYHLDPTFNDPIVNSGKGVLRHTYFNLPDNLLEVDHQWLKEDYPTCTSTEYNYENLNINEYDENGKIYNIVKNQQDLYDVLYEATKNGENSISLKIYFDSNSYSSLISEKLTSIGRELNILYRGMNMTYSEMDRIHGYRYMTVNFQ